ncbi:hypothetical protein Pla108_25340 [Botrimarina colliarenosi]|uniref:Peptidase Do n=1 Tax=Botrimarina colliarenosi TaxID=2528001 RepID=A0A5C6ABH7_9BACT|nr:serine protease [Botrimarina colliarenosi]TWT96760.1 hypothetical protein Pla108_25340 [Botrimarina colliarenosi]
MLRVLLGCLALLPESVGVAQCGPGGCYVGPSRSAPSGPRTHESIARILHHEASGDSIGSGTLVASIAGGGYVLTCAHLFEGPGRTEVQVAGRSLPAELVAIDRSHDLALLKTTGGVGRPVEVAAITAGVVLSACGFGSTGELRCVRGPITGFATASGATEPSVRLRGSVRSGDSGGPVFDTAGRLVAVVWGQRDGETFAMGGAPLRRILARLPQANQSLKPVERTPQAEPPQQPDRWRESIERRIDQIANQPEPDLPALPDDLLRRGDLQQLASRWDQRFDELRSEVTVNVAAPISKRFRGVGSVEALLAAIGIGGPLGFAVWTGLAWWRRRSTRNDTKPSTRSIAVDSPPPPQQVVPETHFVSYQRDDYAKAHQWASEQLSRKFPGSVELLTSLDSLIRQQLNGS